jgi:hypothetical protein
MSDLLCEQRYIIDVLILAPRPDDASGIAAPCFPGVTAVRLEKIHIK